MLQPRSKFTAARRERPRLTAPAVVAMLGGLVGGLLVLIYPHTDLVRRVQQEAPDNLTASYIYNLLRTDPDNHDLRLRLANHYLRSGRTADTRDTVKPLLASPHPALRNQAAWLAWQALERELKQVDASDRRRPALARELRQRLSTLAIEAMPADKVAGIIDAAYAFNDSEFAAALLRRAALHRALPAEWFADRARAAIARGEYRRGADFYLLARQSADRLDARRQYFLAALRALQSGNQLAEALALAERELGEFAHDQETLYFLATLARRASQPAAAERYVRQLLQLSLLETWRQWASANGLPTLRPASLETGDKSADGEPGLPFEARSYDLGYLIFVENGKLEAAYALAASAVRQRPSSRTWRERLATVAEWTARPRVALAEWQWLASRTRHPAAWANVRRLAAALNDSEAQLALLRRDAGGGDPGAIRRLAAALEAEGRPDAALALLQQTGGAPSAEQRRAVIALLERMGRDDDAIAEAERLQVAGQAGPQDLLAQARRLSGRDRREQALALLLGAEASAGDGAAYWRLRAELAGQLDQPELAARAWRRLLSLPDASAADAGAAFWTLQNNAPGEAFELARAAWLARRQPDDLQRALSTGLAADRARDALALIDAMSAEERQQIGDAPGLATLAAQLLMQNRRQREALSLLQTTIERHPNDPVASELLLWLAIELQDRALLGRLLAAYETRWAKQGALHDALGAAWLLLDAPETALRRYFHPRLALAGGDPAWRARYYEVLALAAQAESTARLRRWAGLAVAERRLGAIDESEVGFDHQQALTPALQLAIFAGQRRLAVADGAVIGQVPAQRRAIAATLKLDALGGHSELGLGRHQTAALTDSASTPWRLSHRRQLPAAVAFEAALAGNERSSDSTALLLFGRQDRQALGLSWAATPRDRVGLQFERLSYRIEQGPALGQATRWRLDATHALQLGAYDLEAGVFTATYRADATAGAIDDVRARALQSPADAASGLPTASLFVPESYRQSGLRISSGLRYSQEFTRAPRPYASFGRSWHSVFGAGDELELGLAAAPFGHDHLRLGLIVGRNVGTTGDDRREILLSYRLHY